jgi:hypothetical protein
VQYIYSANSSDRQHKPVSQSWNHVLWSTAGTVCCFQLRVAVARYQFTNADWDVVDYKNKGGLKQDDLRRRREEQQVEIRRQKREENISKRRNLVPSSGIDSDDEAGGSGGLDPPVRTISVICITF